MTHSFLTDFVSEVCRSVDNQFEDNFDIIRFGYQETTSGGFSAKEKIRSLLRKKHYVHKNVIVDDVGKALRLIEDKEAKFQWLYDVLEDVESREMLVKVLAFRALGNRKIRLPLNRVDYWQTLDRIAKMENEENAIRLRFGERDWILYRYDLSDMNIPIEVYTTSQGVMNQFILKQYQCVSNETIVGVKEGDIVIDGGGGWGDTALFFSGVVGEEGKVFSYEFLPSNVEIMKKNKELNNGADNIEIVEKAIWKCSGLKLYYQDKGPASRVSFDENREADGRVETLSIKDLAKQRSLSRVDFIKMDIEGAEIEALKGAIDVIREFRPKLAISVYHKLRDFIEVPSLIDSLGLGYRFYLRHFTIHSEETVLFAHVDT